METQSVTAIVLFSGGQDSTTCLVDALTRYEQVETVGFDYGQRHRIELDCRGRILAAIREQFREMVQDDRMRSPADELLENAVMSSVKQMMQDLDEREYNVLRMRFGLENSETHTLKEIGELMGLTRERVRQIETEALKRLGEGLRDPFDMEMIMPF